MKIFREIITRERITNFAYFIGIIVWIAVIKYIQAYRRELLHHSYGV